MSTRDTASDTTSSDPERQGVDGEHPREPVAGRRPPRGFWVKVASLGAAGAAVILVLFLVLFGVTPSRLFGVKSSHQGVAQWQTEAVEAAQAEGKRSARGDPGDQLSLGGRARARS